MLQRPDSGGPAPVGDQLCRGHLRAEIDGALAAGRGFEGGRMHGMIIAHPAATSDSVGSGWAGCWRPSRRARTRGHTEKVTAVMISRAITTAVSYTHLTLPT